MYISQNNIFYRYIHARYKLNYNLNCIKISRGNKNHNNHITNSIPPQIPLSPPCVFFDNYGWLFLKANDDLRFFRTATPLFRICHT